MCMCFYLSFCTISQPNKELQGDHVHNTIFGKLYCIMKDGIDLVHIIHGTYKHLLCIFSEVYQKYHENV